MLLKKTLLITLLLFLGSLLQAAQKDTVSVMIYNLLFYGHYTSFCTPFNNNVEDKDEYLSTIFDHTRPDLFAVNEMGPDPLLAERILDNVINIAGNPEYSHAGFTNTANSSLVNMLFYNTEKFTLYDEKVVASVVRDINLYSLYYNDPELDFGADTVFVHLIVAHLKAGSRASDQQTREQEISAVMKRLASMDISGNIMFLGDFNMNSSFEQAYQILTFYPDEEIRFFDPVDKPGVWFNNYEMAPYHTQSPRTGYHECFVTGGLDDRYDQILVTSSIMDGTLGLGYIEGSYETIGQDGKRFNSSLIDPPNHSEPEDVIDALYNMSDHLPVKLSMEVTGIATSVREPEGEAGYISTVSVPGSSFDVVLEGISGRVVFEIYNMTGQRVKAWEIYSKGGSERVPLDIDSLRGGSFLVRVIAPGIPPYSGKFMVY